MAEQENAAPEPAPAKKSKKKLIIIAVACLVICGGGGMLAMRFRGTPAPAEAAAKAEESGVTSRVKAILNLDAFLANLADVEAPRFIKVTFRLGLDEEGLGEKYAEDPVIISAVRDRILTLLSMKTAEELLTQEGKEKLRKEIKEKVNPIFPKGKIVEVFILDFVVQL